MHLEMDNVHMDLISEAIYLLLFQQRGHGLLELIIKIKLKISYIFNIDIRSYLLDCYQQGLVS